MKSSNLNLKNSSPDKLPSFLDIAKKYGTDKVTDHQYWFIYDKYLPAIRNKKVKMLEIGLGCNMVGYTPFEFFTRRQHIYKPAF